MVKCIEIVKLVKLNLNRSCQNMDFARVWKQSNHQILRSVELSKQHVGNQLLEVVMLLSDLRFESCHNMEAVRGRKKVS